MTKSAPDSDDDQISASQHCLPPRLMQAEQDARLTMQALKSRRATKQPTRAPDYRRRETSYKVSLSTTGSTAMKISEEQYRKNLARLTAGATVAGPNDPIYLSGLRVNSIPSLGQKSRSVPKAPPSQLRKAK